jgi:phosphoribosylaminoimidazolecarboxamide formyltransferase / IMP cyclohydrolase
MIRRALLSVSDKTGIVALARGLAERGIELLATGGTLALLRAERIPARSVEDYTSSPEIMGGRVKTLHPRVHGGILARLPDDEADLQRVGGAPIDLVVVNLYPFERVLADPASSHEDVIENIDIGGPAMLRSAAKNHARVAVVCDPADYEPLLAELESSGEIGLGARLQLGAKAFAHTAGYDGAVAAYLSTGRNAAIAVDAPGPPEAPDALTTASAGPEEPAFPRYLTLGYERVATLRYGENPHQPAAWYRMRNAAAGSLSRAESIGAGGKELSYNNLVDLEAALEAVREHAMPAAVVVKHTNPCGLGVADTLAEAYRLAREGDPVSAFGGIVACNRPVDLATAEVVAETFIEAVIAPDFEPAALERLRKKKQLRLVRTGPLAPPATVVPKPIGGGLLLQASDLTGVGQVEAGKVVSARLPTPAELRALGLGWLVCKHVKSNAIVLASPDGRQVVGVGAGQMSRVESVEIACRKAGDRAVGAVLASDGFFPFPDGVELAIARGITAVVQPGGSVRDAEVVAAADKGGIAMVVTGARHFRH